MNIESGQIYETISGGTLEVDEVNDDFVAYHFIYPDPPFGVYHRCVTYIFQEDIGLGMKLVEEA